MQLPHFKAEATRIEGLTPSREDKMRQSIVVFEKVMNDIDFQTKLLQFPFQFDVPDDPNRNLTPEQVVIKIYDAQEHFKPDKDNTANLHWIIRKKKRPLFSRRPAIGFGSPGGVEFFTYTWFFDQTNNLPDIAGHIAHEWSHKIGFDHLFNYHPGRENTVPYAFGNLVEKYARNHVA